MRAIRQITASSNEFGDGSIAEVLYALCDDGTVWRLLVTGANENVTPEWRQMIGIPEATEMKT